MQDIITLLSNLFMIDEQKKKELNNALGQLNKPEFKEVYDNIVHASNTLKGVLNNTIDYGIAKKSFEIEANNLKHSFDKLIKDGYISQCDADLLRNKVNAEQNMVKLKSLIENFKKQNI